MVDLVSEDDLEVEKVLEDDLEEEKASERYVIQ